MQTIQAMVNPRLLTKANRLFTGSLPGRIIEILQNARRAGATQVEITNQDGHVTVHDNGKGIDDFAKLLDMGGSGWEQELEASEDPAGVGLFCLAPREVTIRSNSKMVTISGDSWTGVPVEVLDDPSPVSGTVLQFEDEPWTSSEVDLNAVFCGMDVTADGTPCPRESFLSDQATAYPDLGCRIEVRESENLSPWHRLSRPFSYYSNNALVSFHGQVVSFSFTAISEHPLHFLVDLTGEPTGIRLMLPARTCLVENEAFTALKAAMELETYRYLQNRGHHRLPYKEYLRARELGINLPESDPVYRVGVLSGDSPEPIEVPMPKDFPLTKCYRFDSAFKGGAETDEANVHLLGALGKFDEPFVPVDIRREYDGYSWAKLPTIGKVKVKAGKELQQESIWSGMLVCVDQIEVTVHTSDGRKWSSAVCMAIRPPTGKKKHCWWDQELLVTQEACRLNNTDLLYHLGGFSDDGDTWDTQEYQFSEQLDQFWAQLVGPYEQLRRTILESLHGMKPDWKTVSVSADGKLTIVFKDGSKKTITPPKSAS